MILLNEDGRIQQKRIDLLDKIDSRKVLDFYIENLDNKGNFSAEYFNLLTNLVFPYPYFVDSSNINLLKLFNDLPNDSKKQLLFINNLIKNLDSNFNNTQYSDMYLYKKYIINNGLLPFYYWATLVPYIRFKKLDTGVQISSSDEEVATQNTNLLTLARNIKNNPYQHIIEKCKK